MVLGLLAGALNWSTLPIVAGVAIVIPLIGFRGFWREAKFWVTLLVLSAVQVPVVIVAQPFAERLKFPFILTFGIMDCACVVSAIYRICVNGSEKSN